VFPKIKFVLKGRRFHDIEYVQKNVMILMKAIPQQEFQNCFQQWQHRWAKCSPDQGEYYEGDPYK
jgi:hypothetical protein